MNKWRKKPVVVEAEKVCDILQWAKKRWSAMPAWLISAYDAGNVVFHPDYISVYTSKGVMRAEKDDYIVSDPNDIFPCKPDIFAATYDPVGAADVVAIPARRQGKTAAMGEWQDCFGHVVGAADDGDKEARVAECQAACDKRCKSGYYCNNRKACDVAALAREGRT